MPRKPVPLTAQEEAAWRALARAVLVIPKALDADLLTAEGLSVTEYMVLMNLSEAPGRCLRMNELATRVSISVSGLSRAVGRLEREGLVERAPCEEDRRGLEATLTAAGLRRLRRAWPVHLDSVRRHVLDHLADLDLAVLAAALTAVAESEPGPPARRPGHPVT